MPSPDAKSSIDIAVVVDLSKNQKGEWIGTFSMPDVGANGLPLAKLVAGQSSVSFTVPDVPSAPSFDGKLSADGSLSGTFTTGTTKVPLSLKRTGAAKVALPAANSTISKAFEGAWQGSYDSGRSTRFHLVLKLTRRPDGTAAGTLTNIDGGNVETPVTGIDQTGNQLQFEIRSVGGKFRGSMNAAGTEIKGAVDADGLRAFDLHSRRLRYVGQLGPAEGPGRELDGHPGRRRRGDNWNLFSSFDGLPMEPQPERWGIRRRTAGSFPSPSSW